MLTDQVSRVLLNIVLIAGWTEAAIGAVILAQWILRGLIEEIRGVQPESYY